MLTGSLPPFRSGEADVSCSSTVAAFLFVHRGEGADVGGVVIHSSEDEEESTPPRSADVGLQPGGSTLRARIGLLRGRGGDPECRKASSGQYYRDSGTVAVSTVRLRGGDTGQAVSGSGAGASGRPATVQRRLAWSKVGGAVALDQRGFRFTGRVGLARGGWVGDGKVRQLTTSRRPIPNNFPSSGDTVTLTRGRIIAPTPVGGRAGGRWVQVWGGVEGCGRGGNRVRSLDWCDFQDWGSARGGDMALRKCINIHG